MKILTAILFLSLCLNFLPAKAQEVHFALNHWPPFGLTEGDQEAGIDIDIGREIAKRMQFTLNVRKCPFKRCLTEMEVGLLDLQAGIARNEERAKYMHYAETPYHHVSVVFHVRKGEGERLTRYEDLRGLRIGAVAKSHYFDPFNHDENLIKIEVPEEKQLPAMLAAGRIDTYVGTNPNASYDVLTRGFKDRLELAPYQPEADVPVYFAISRKSPLISRIDELNQVIISLHEEGVIEEIVAKYR
ncbi:substrate-binding periplasmic protein [Aestuariispira insulae]|uniref:Amino acid ABC transporter substrate-binding protein (PAAT family) n=1 Tax=Aestuariispira insulae TaxID=1461337 RepID=A0A3D9HKE6_9PROT|nr:transporter substrate-binding domain-containing protein [Aestuariispira insulae]RED49751.1 amino acid ABC transporter substrate-binding protein (PAAT family) [Aestuariispira insulae]